MMKTEHDSISDLILDPLFSPWLLAPFAAVIVVVYVVLLVLTFFGWRP